MFITNSRVVGECFWAPLTEAQVQGQVGTGTILADGRSITGSVLAALTGQTNATDLRGIGPRGKNNGRSDGNEDPSGEATIGEYQGDKVRAHNHVWSNSTSGAAATPQRAFDGSGNIQDYNRTTGGNNNHEEIEVRTGLSHTINRTNWTGGVYGVGVANVTDLTTAENFAETRVKAVIGNWFQRIN